MPTRYGFDPVQSRFTVQAFAAGMLSFYRIRPVTALAGTIKLRDDLKLAFDIAGLPEET